MGKEVHSDSCKSDPVYGTPSCYADYTSSAPAGGSKCSDLTNAASSSTSPGAKSSSSSSSKK